MIKYELSLGLNDYFKLHILKNESSTTSEFAVLKIRLLLLSVKLNI